MGAVHEVKGYFLRCFAGWFNTAKSAIKMCKLALNATGPTSSTLPLPRSSILAPRFSIITPHSSDHVLSSVRGPRIVNCRRIHLPTGVANVAAVGRPAFKHFMANCNFHINLRCTLYCGLVHVRKRPRLCPLILSATAAYNFVYNYIEIKSKVKLQLQLQQQMQQQMQMQPATKFPAAFSGKSRKNFPPAGDTYLISSTYSVRHRCTVSVNVPPWVTATVPMHLSVLATFRGLVANWLSSNIH